MSKKWAWLGHAVVLAVVATLAAVAVGSGSAAIIATGGAVQQIAPPPSVDFGALESDTTIFAFEERQCVTLTSDLAVDITTTGTFDEESDLTPGVIPAGTRVSTAFLHADPVGTDPPPILLEGSVTKSTDILGLIVLSRTLDASDSLGAPGTIYPTGRFGRGLELTAEQADQITLSADRRTVELRVQTRLHVDQVRIIEACPPTPPPGTRTPGYWKNQPSAWPVSSIVLGGKTYTKAQAIDILKKFEKSSDMTLVLAAQLIATKLSVLVGNNPSCIITTINAADAWLTTYPVGSKVKASSAAWKLGEPLKNTLDAYNNGQLCAAAAP